MSRIRPFALTATVAAAALALPLASGRQSLNPQAGSQRRQGPGDQEAGIGCEDTIKDQATQACIAVSSVPMLGFLYPLGMELNIDAAGNVGIGTTSPTSKLTVAGTIESTSGGLVFPDGSMQATAANWTTQSRTPMQIALLRWYDVNESGNRISVGAGANGAYDVVFDGSHMWVTNYYSSDISKVRASDGALIQRYPTGTSPRGLAFDGFHMWVASYGANTVTKHRAGDGSIVGTYPVGAGPFDVAYDGQSIWVVNSGDDTVSKLDLAGNPAGTYPVGTTPWRIAFDGTHLWVTNSNSASVTKLDTAGNTVGTYPAGNKPYGLATDGSSVWIANFDDDTVTRLRASDGANLGTTAVGSQPIGVAFDGTTLWVANFSGTSVTRIRASDGVVLGTHAAGNGAHFLAFDRANIWVTNFQDDDVRKL